MKRSIVSILLVVICSCLRPGGAGADEASAPRDTEVALAERQLGDFDKRIAEITKGLQGQDVVELRNARQAFYSQVEPSLIKILATRQGELRSLVASKGLIAEEVRVEQARVDRLQRLLAFVNSIGMKFIIIEPGTFMMGSPPGEVGRDPRRETLHKVTLTRSFRMGVTLVTRGQFAIFVGQSGYKTDCEKAGAGYAYNGKMFTRVANASWESPGFVQTDEHPVVNVSWNDATAFCKWLSEKEKKKYRLPTEAEWEFACRGGAETAYFWGNDPNAGFGYVNCFDLSAKQILAIAPGIPVFNFQDGFVFTSPVASFKPNSLGLYDMIGNTWQWCSDYFAGPYPGDDAVNPKGSPNGDERGSHVVRGGSWAIVPIYCRCAARGHVRNDLQPNNDFTGFRVCLDFGGQE